MTDAAGTNARRLPAGACDCHFHVFDAARYAYGAGRHYTPPDATLADYLALCDRFGIDRSVLVHPTVFGADHASFEDILRLQVGRMRGVAVVSPDTPDADIARWHAIGARGTRITTIFGGGSDIDTITKIVCKVRPFGWHVQVLVDLFENPDFIAQVHAVGVEVVADHLGHHAPAELLPSAGFANLLSLLKDGVAWVKLSAPYRLAAQGHVDTGVQAVVEALVKANPAQLVWGTDWPHPNSPHPVPTDAQLVAQVFDWLPDEVLRRAVLVDNPGRLYWNDAAQA
ncbi:MAG: 2-pyrone-4,6-dicarboxylate hydrolase [Comamonadaceae bacterium]|nr:MAG: 2-pyrone-4,6-dicarboxylate hydrolase [Comamonadaceae bacterium]